jgi:hypothetical protein
VKQPNKSNQLRKTKIMPPAKTIGALLAMAGAAYTFINNSDGTITLKCLNTGNATMTEDLHLKLNEHGELVAVPKLQVDVSEDQDYGDAA